MNDVLQFDFVGRTIGVSNELLGNPVPGEITATLKSGFSLYTNQNAAPKTIYIDDVMLSNQETPAPE